MSKQSLGKTDFGPRFKPRHRYVLDNSISPRLASALRKARWDIVSVAELFRVEPNESVADEEIIPLCAQENRAWVTLDKRARWQHAAALKRNLVSTLWIRQPRNGGMSAAYQLAVLARSLALFDELRTCRRNYAIHYVIGWQLGSQPEAKWEQCRAQEPD